MPTTADPTRIAAVTAAVTATFERIHAERMAGLPILHPGLAVAVVGARDWQGDWLGVLVTPWCMNLLLVPAPGSARTPGLLGTKQVLELPAGAFELTASVEDAIGPFAACPLFSPMDDFADQAGAVATAESIMAALFEPAAADPAPAAGTGRGLSRRDLLRGRRSGG